MQEIAPSFPITLLWRLLCLVDISPQREESIAKRRNFQPSNVDDGIDSDDDVELGTTTLQDNLPAMLQAVYSDNQDVQLESTMKFRK